MKTPPLVLSIEAPGRPPIRVELRGTTAAGVRRVAEVEGLTVDEAARRLLVRGVDIVNKSAGAAKM